MPARRIASRLCAAALVSVHFILSPLLAGAEERPREPNQTRDLLFERDVAPILTSLCVHCHGWVHRKGGLDVRSLPLLLKGGKSGPAIVRGSAEKSLLVQKIANQQMPPTGKVKQELTGKNFIVANVVPTGENLKTIRAWINAGAPARYEGGPPTKDQAPALTNEDRSWWAFQKPLRPNVPDFCGTDLPPASIRVRTPIDAFVLVKLHDAGLSFNVEAPPAVLMRRAYLDVLGIPPSPQEVDAYLADPAPDKYERLIDRLLASPHYGERWGRHWLDAAGYCEIRGREFGGKTPFLAEGIWRYRDYVIQAFNEDMPFDQFLMEQLAGDELVDWRDAETFTPKMKRSLIATGFLRLAADFTAPNNNGDLDAAPIRHQVINDTIKIVGSNLLGLTLQCAQCHSHKYEPISQLDYYRLRAIFTPAFNAQNWVDYVHRFQYEISPKELAELKARNARIDAQAASLKQQVAHLRGGAEPKPQEDAAKRKIAELESKISKLLAGKRSPGEKIQAVWDVGPPPAQHIFRRGEFTTPGAEVTPGVLAVLDDPEDPFKIPQIKPGRKTSGYRTALARWLTDPAHPLTSRVFVNRVWQHYFSRGIVATSNNFGRSGARPTHPNLLDWLARDFVDQGWQLKRLHRIILTSTTYRQASQIQKVKGVAGVDPHLIDPENRLLWRMPLRRLESEVIRDAMLTVSGTLDRTMQGQSVPVAVSPGGIVEIAEAKVYRWSLEKEAIYADTLKLATPSSRFRRSVYLFARRNYHLTELAVFDQPIVQTNCTQRKPSAVVQQSLAMLNGKSVQGQAGFFAQRVNREAGAAPRARIESAFRIALGRKPLVEETASAEALLESQVDLYLRANPKLTGEQAADTALIDLCQMLFNTNEFIYVQ